MLTSLNRYAPQALGVLRIVTALIFFAHGAQKLLGFPAPPSWGMPAAFTLPWIAGVLELVGGVFILIGFQTRIVAFILSGEMAVAYWMGHAAKGGFYPVLNGGDAAILYCFVFLYLVFAGAGAFAIDKDSRA